MISDYYLQNIYNLVDIETIKQALLNSHFILTMHGDSRDVISHLGKDMFTDCQIVDLSENIFHAESLLNKFENTEEQGELKIAVDISLIDRKTLANVFSLIAKLAIQRTCSVDVIYTLAVYSPPSGELESNNSVKPVSSFFSGWSTRPGLPIMTVVGLGYERDKAIGAIEYLESSRTYLYIPKSQEDRYYQDVITENNDLLDSINERDLISYKVESPSEAIYSLDSLITAYKNRYKVVLFPFGPKIFYALSLVASIPHPEASVWYVSGEDGDNDSSQDREVSTVVGFHFNISKKA